MSSNDIYGVVDSEGTHTDVSRTERGAKNYASRHNKQYGGGIVFQSYNTDQLKQQIIACRDGQ